MWCVVDAGGAPLLLLPASKPRRAPGTHREAEEVDGAIGRSRCTLVASQVGVNSSSSAGTPPTSLTGKVGTRLVTWTIPAGGHIDDTGCHPSVSCTIRPTTDPLTPGCQIAVGYLDHTLPSTGFAFFF